MSCYKNMIFCSFWKECDHGLACPASLTPEVKKEAKKSNMELAQYAERPNCFVEIDLA